MDCQSRLKTEGEVQPLNSEKPIEWIGSAPSIASAPALQSSLSTAPSDLYSAAPHQTSTVHLPQHLTQTLLTSQTLHEALFSFAQILGEAFATDCCLILPLAKGLPQVANVGPINELKNLQHTYCYFTATFQYSPQLFAIFDHPLIQGNLTKVEPIVIDDLQAFSQRSGSSNRSSDGSSNRSSNRLPSKSGKSVKASGKTATTAQPVIPSHVRAVLMLNMQFQGRLNGTLVLIRSQPYDWKETDVQLLKSLSPQVAVALAQNQLEQQMEQQTRYQNLINQLTVAIRNSWELDQIFQLAVEGSAAALQVDRGLVFLLKYTDPLHKSRSHNIEAKASMVAEWLEPLSETPRGDRVREDRTGVDQSVWASSCPLCRQVLTSPEPIAISFFPDVAPEKIQVSEVTPAPFFNLDRFPALLLAPLENQGTVLGSFVLQQQQHRIWTFEEIAFVKLVAAQLSTAIIQVRTLQHVQALVQERTAQLQRSLDVQAKLYEKTRQQVEQLRRLHEEREEFLSTVSHELRTPLTSMTLAIRMLRQADLSAERRTRYLDILEQQCVQETQLINDLLALRKLETSTSTVQLQKLDIRYLIRDTAQSIAETLAERNLTLELDLPPKPLNLYTEPDSLSRILMELLANARKYADVDTVIQLRVFHELTPQTNQVVIALQNVGAGILPDELPYIFDKFRRGQGVTQQAIQGTGLGLALVKRLVEYLGGAIGASSHPLEHQSSWQTRFTVTLPQCPEGLIQSIA